MAVNDGSTNGHDQPVAMTVLELRAVEQATAILTAVAERRGGDSSKGYSADLLRHVEVLKQLTARHPQRSDPEWFRTGVKEHKRELGQGI